jgi:primosomal protein N' (replication factor Y)
MTSDSPKVAAVVETAVALPVEKTFHYRVPDSIRAKVAPGVRLLVPFGSRTVTGYVLSWVDAPARETLRDAVDLLDEEPVFTPAHLAFYREVAELTLAPLGEVIKTALPGGLAPGSRGRVSLTEKGEAELLQLFGDPAERAVLLAVKRLGSAAPARIIKEAGKPADAALARKMVRRGLLAVSQEVATRGVAMKTEVWVKPTVLGRAADRETIRKRAPRQAEVLDLLDDGERPWSKLAEAGATDAAAKALRAKGFVEFHRREALRGPLDWAAFAQGRPEALTGEQTAAVAAVVNALEAGEARTFLLHGVTGSGKTEVYLRVIERVLAAGRQAIVLCPEIALTPQLRGRFTSRFPGQVATLHSGLAPGERFDEWRRVLRGDARVVVGARSAIFAPVQALGAVIVDEEHEDSYTQEDGVLYDARVLAEVLGKAHRCPVVFGSATPSVDLYHRAREGHDARLLELTHRIERVPLPEVVLVDLRQTAHELAGVRHLFSQTMIAGIEETLRAGKQAILFLNRRGFAAFAQCRDCGKAIGCPRCAISLTYHKPDHALRCHYCGEAMPMPAACPSCGGRLKSLGIGTQQVEEELRRFFPAARVERMDRDTVARKGSLEGLLSRFGAREFDVLIGTQMVAKGHDFPGVSFIGIINADTALHLPDYRAAERTFALLTQVSGRAGRRAERGRVVIQTRDPEHYAIRAALTHDYRAFFDREIAFRLALSYPPAVEMGVVRLAAPDEKELKRYGKDLAETLRRLLDDDGPGAAWSYVGPSPAAFSRLQGRYRYQVILRAPDPPALRTLARRIRRETDPWEPRRKAGSVTQVIDPRPASLL